MIDEPTTGTSKPAVPSTSSGNFVPLSDQLMAMVDDPAAGDLTLNQLLERTATRGPFGLIILLCLPFMTPVSLPGVSNVFGLVIVLLAWRIFQGRPARLPKQLGDRSIEGKILGKIVRASIKVLRFIERLTRPRGPVWVRGNAARKWNALALIFGALMLAAPIPPIIPLSNLIPAVGIILIAAAMMEEDVIVLVFGYVATLASAGYLITVAVVQYALILKLWHRFSDPILGFFRGLFS